MAVTWKKMCFADQKLDAFGAPDDNTNLNATTSAHGLVVKATAPASGFVNYVGIGNGETAYTNKALFDATAPSTQAFGDAAAVGSSLTAARIDHKHAMMAAPTSVSGSSGSCTGNAATATTATNLSGGSVAATTITATGNITAYYSDNRLKKFLGKITGALSKVMSLTGYYFVENETAKALGCNNDRIQVGISAQELDIVLPEAVTESPISAEYLTVWYEKIIPLLIEAIKEQQGQIVELKTAIMEMAK